VVEFDTADNAETAICTSPLSYIVSFQELCTNTLIAKFTGYQYGGRPLGLSYVRYTNQSNGEHMDTDATGGLTQDQIM
jgi:hypothetical protein